jgi:hypothetical protein
VSEYQRQAGSAGGELRAVEPRGTRYGAPGLKNRGLKATVLRPGAIALDVAPRWLADSPPGPADSRTRVVDRT